MKSINALILILTLIVCNIGFAITPALKEFTDGNRTKYTTAGHPKSKGLDMTVSFPNSWMAMEGERPNIVQKFVSAGGKGLEMALILIKTIPGSNHFTESELKEFFAPEEMKTMIPDGATFIDAKRTKIEGLNAGILEYRMLGERAGLKVWVQTLSYHFFYGSNYVQLLCSVSSGMPKSPNDLSKQMNDFKPLFYQMANSIILSDRYK